MPKRYTEAQRVEMALRAFQLSLHGLSHRAIARELSIDPKTVARLLDEEKARLRSERGDEALESCATYKAIIQKCLREMDNNPSPHALSQLAHSANAARNSIDLLLGLRSPAKKEISIDHKILQEVVVQGIELLDDRELEIYGLLVSKMAGEISPNKCVLDLPARDNLIELPQASS